MSKKTTYKTLRCNQCGEMIVECLRYKVGTPILLDGRTHIEYTINCDGITAVEINVRDEHKCYAKK